MENSTLKSSVSVVVEAKSSNHVEVTEERVVCYSTKPSGLNGASNTERFFSLLNVYISIFLFENE